MKSILHARIKYIDHCFSIGAVTKFFRYLAVLMFVSGSFQAIAQDDKTAILKVLEDQRQAWNHGDLDGYMQGYIKSDSLLFVGSKGPKYGWETTLQSYRKGYPDKAAMGYLTFDIEQVKLLGNGYAFVLGAWHLKREKDEPSGYFTLLMVKQNGYWKVAADHSS